MRGFEEREFLQFAVSGMMDQVRAASHFRMPACASWSRTASAALYSVTILTTEMNRLQDHRPPADVVPKEAGK